jgi:hypothetical protein
MTIDSVTARDGFESRRNGELHDLYARDLLAFFSQRVSDDHRAEALVEDTFRRARTRFVEPAHSLRSLLAIAREVMLDEIVSEQLAPQAAVAATPHASTDPAPPPQDEHGAPALSLLTTLRAALGRVASFVHTSGAHGHVPASLPLFSGALAAAAIIASATARPHSTGPSEVIQTEGAMQTIGRSSSTNNTGFVFAEPGLGAGSTRSLGERGLRLTIPAHVRAAPTHAPTASGPEAPGPNKGGSSGEPQTPGTSHGRPNPGSDENGGSDGGGGTHGNVHSGGTGHPESHGNGGSNGSGSNGSRGNGGPHGNGGSNGSHGNGGSHGGHGHGRD